MLCRREALSFARTRSPIYTFRSCPHPNEQLMAPPFLLFQANCPPNSDPDAAAARLPARDQTCTRSLLCAAPLHGDRARVTGVSPPLSPSFPAPHSTTNTAGNPAHPPPAPAPPAPPHSALPPPTRHVRAGLRARGAGRAGVSGWVCCAS